MTCADPVLLRSLPDAELVIEAARLERRLDQLDDAIWPAAGVERAEARDGLAAVLAEAARRRARHLVGDDDPQVVGGRRA